MKENNHHLLKQKTITSCIIGKPNAGKSTLLNNLIGQKISIVTPKVQTTRSIITGIITLAETQVILFDTPGIFEPKARLEKAMVRCAWSSLNGADLVMMIIDSTKPLDEITKKIIIRIKEQKLNIIFLLNKVDLKKDFIDIVSYLKEQFTDPIIFPISATSGKGVDKLLDYIIKIAPATPWLYGADDLTNLPMRFLAAEITREQLFLKMHEELPYNLTVQTETWEEKETSVKINQVIIVTRENYKMMILGKGGQKIKEIGTIARLEIEKILEKKVHLFLFVKVRDWENSPEYYNYMGLKLPKENT